MGYAARASSSPHVRTVWRAWVEEPDHYVDAGSEFWGISFVRRADSRLAAELNGPSITARSFVSVAGEEYWGLELEAHVVLPGVDKQVLGGGFTEVPVEDGRFRLTGHLLPVPSYDELEGFVEQLLAAGVIVADDDVRRALAGDESGYARRSWQRRVRAVTGLTRVQVAGLERARRAFVLLQEGHRPADVAQRVGFADQAHLTRSLRLVRGETPAAIMAAQRDESA